MHLEEIFAVECRRYGIALLPEQDIVSDTFLFAFPCGGYRIRIKRDAYGPGLLAAVAIQVGRVALEQRFRRSAYSWGMQRKGDWWAAELWAARRLITDRMMRFARRMGAETWELAADAGVTERLAVVRYNDWTERSGELLAFPVARPTDTVAWCDNGEGAFF